ncbi:MAG: hypothetical protein AAB266_03250 [Nitrospirota bacterium]
MIKGELEEMKGKEVVVTYNGLNYKGILMDVTADDVDLKGEEGWVVLPIDGVTLIKRR